MKKLREVFFLLGTFLNYTIIGALKMTVEAVLGVTISGRKLTMLGRINHLIVQGTNVTAYWWALHGRFRDAGMIYAVSWLFDSFQYYPEIFSSVGRIIGLDKLIPRLDRLGLSRIFFLLS